ncbi:MAG: trypsin-like peptidase domain-containing protein [Planctomycetes bacterium]|nr:trypsin-like peptidase domain-containing protein [Planctomycetota bacterium]
MTRTPRNRLGWLLITATTAGVLWVGLGDRLLTHWAYAVERGQIQANNEELASVQQVSNAFRMVAKTSRPGVVHISVSGSGDSLTGSGQRRLERLQREVEELENRIREPSGSDSLRELLLRYRDKQAELQGLMQGLRQPPGTGSGIILDEQGYILTNNHVVGGRSEITVRLHDGREFQAKSVGTDPKTDVAVIQIDATDLHPLKIGDSDAMEVGDWVLAVGAPFGLSQSVTHGIISAKGRQAVVAGSILYQDFIQTDAAINPGNSGGPLLNLRGEVIGVNTAIATNGDAYNAGVAFTIPSNMALHIAEELKQHGEVARGWLGISMAELSDDDMELLQLRDKRGVMVDVVYEDSPAQKAGLLCEDIVLSINGAATTTMERLRAVVADVRPKQTAKLRVLRDGREQQVEVIVGKQPENIAASVGGVTAIAGRDIAPLTLRVRSMRAGLPQTLVRALADVELAHKAASFDEDSGVFVVARIGRDSDGSIGIEPGELLVACNGEPVASVGDLVQALAAQHSGKAIKLQVLDSAGKRRMVYIERR